MADDDGEGDSRERGSVRRTLMFEIPGRYELGEHRKGWKGEEYEAVEQLTPRNLPQLPQTSLKTGGHLERQTNSPVGQTITLSGLSLHQEQVPAVVQTNTSRSPSRPYSPFGAHRAHGVKKPNMRASEISLQLKFFHRWTAEVSNYITPPICVLKYVFNRKKEF